MEAAKIQLIYGQPTVEPEVCYWQACQVKIKTEKPEKGKQSSYLGIGKLKYTFFDSGDIEIKKFEQTEGGL